MSDTVAATTVGPGVHPRILARMKLVALARRQDMVLTQLDEMIAKLDDLAQFTDRFLDQAARARELRQQMAYLAVGSPKNLALLDGIKQHIASLRANFAADGLTLELSA